MIDLTIENGTSPLRQLDGLGSLGFTFRPEYAAAAAEVEKARKMKKMLLIGGGAVVGVGLLAFLLTR